MGIDPLTNKIKKKKIKYFIKGPSTKKWIKIVTATNREYIMTPTHKFMYLIDEKFKFKEAKEARVDDKLPVLHNFSFNSNIDKIDLVELFKRKLSEKEKKEIIFIKDGKEKCFFDVCNENINNYKNAKLRWKFSNHEFPAILKIDSNLLRILGYYASEGHSRINKWVAQVCFRICNKETQRHLINLIKRTFGMDASLGEDNSKITLCSKLIYYLFKSLGTGAGAYDKRIPKFILGLDKKLVKEYVSAYFDGDGSVIKNKNLVFYSVSRDLLDDLALLLAKFQIVGRYFRTSARLPGKKVLERYKELRKDPKRHVLNHLVIGVKDSFIIGKFLDVKDKKKAWKIKHLHNSCNEYLKYNSKQVPMEVKGDYFIDFVKKIEIIKDKKNSYCVEIDWKKPEDRNILWGEQIINTRCDGDEAAVTLLLDTLINFSREYLPTHRGSTQDAPLILNARIRAGEVDDMVFNIDVFKEFPVEFYNAAEEYKPPYTVKLEKIKDRLLGGDVASFKNLGYTHETGNINNGPLCSSYKTLETMGDKVRMQMGLAEKIRAVNTSDVARLVIERHFIRDIRGNLRKFSGQQFRCVDCNEKFRRPPLAGKCTKCDGRIIFTIAEGSIVKYLEPAIQLAEKYNISPYLKQSLELTKSFIESIFGRETEKQEALGKWF